MLSNLASILGNKLALQVPGAYLSPVNESILMPVRFRLQALLDAHDPPMSQSELARRSGISLVTVNGIANNRTKQVSLDTIDRLARALQVEPGELFESMGTRRRGK